MRDKINILFTSTGRRVELIKKFKELYNYNNIQGRVITADIKSNVPTAYVSDQHYIVSKVSDENYIKDLLDICLKEKIDLVIPLIDSELTVLAEKKEIFEDNNVKIFVSSKELIDIANNKVNTYQFFSMNGIPTPRVFNEEEISRKEYRFPLMIKPHNGSSSKGVTIVRTEEELTFFKHYIPNAMVQEFINGEEYTIDVMVDFSGNIKTIVPRLRIETRAGEVSKGITKKDQQIIKAVENIIKVLPGPVGCLTLQCFKQENGRIDFIEINPRFGGGIPLSIEAGANFPLWSIEMCEGVSFNEQDFSWKEDLSMLRYDAAVFSEKNG